MSVVKGMKKGIPIAIAYIPYAMGLGFFAKKVGINTEVIFFMSLIIYAGSSELLMLNLYLVSTNIKELIIPAVVVNIRYLLINLPIITKQKNESMIFKILSSLLLTDEAVAYLSSKKIYNAKMTFGFGLIAYISFCLSTLVGAILGNIIDPFYQVALNFVLYAIFLSLLVDSVREKFSNVYIIILTLIIKLSLSKILTSNALVILLSIVLGALIPTIIKIKLSKNLE